MMNRFLALLLALLVLTTVSSLQSVALPKKAATIASKKAAFPSSPAQLKTKVPLSKPAKVIAKAKVVPKTSNPGQLSPIKKTFVTSSAKVVAPKKTVAPAKKTVAPSAKKTVVSSAKKTTASKVATPAMKKKESAVVKQTAYVGSVGLAVLLPFLFLIAAALK